METKVSTTYTPSIVGVTPTASPAETTDAQGVEQSKEVTFKPVCKATVNGVEKRSANRHYFIQTVR